MLGTVYHRTCWSMHDTISSLFVDSENDDLTFDGFHSSDIQTKTKELLNFAKHSLSNIIENLEDRSFKLDSL